MHDALIRGDKSKRRYLARVAKRRSDYICPFCDAPVDLRRGEIREPYFAHRAQEAADDCERYFRGVGESSSVDPSKRHSIETEDSLTEPGLGLTVQHKKWTLYLRLPEIDLKDLGGESISSLATAEAIVRSGTATRTTISALDLRPGVGAARVPVPPSLTPYQLETAGHWPQSVGVQRWHTTASGLNKFGTMFRQRASEWLRVRKNSALRAGEALRVVALKPSTPPRSCAPQILHSVETSDGTWCAWEIVVPPSRNESAVRWLNALGFVVLDAAWAFDFVSPPRAISTDSRFVFPAGGQVLVQAVGPERGASTQITLNAGSTDYRLHLRCTPHSAEVCFEFTGGWHGEHSVRDASGTHVLEVDVAPPLTSHQLCGLIGSQPQLRVQIGNVTLFGFADARVCSSDIAEMTIAAPYAGQPPLVPLKVQCEDNNGLREWSFRTSDEAKAHLTEVCKGSGIQRVRLIAPGLGAIELSITVQNEQAPHDYVRAAHQLASRATALANEAGMARGAVPLAELRDIPRALLVAQMRTFAPGALRATSFALRRGRIRQSGANRK